ncbi:MAG: hypothetical protein ACRDGS_00555 [Chloroflexota bacterium]
MTTRLEHPSSSKQDATREQATRAEAMRPLLQEWLEDESGYDECVWPELKRPLERD